MSGDEPLEPVRTRPPQGRSILIGGVAFLGGIAGTIAVAQFSGGLWQDSAPIAAPAEKSSAPAPAPAPVLPAATDVATLSARESELAGRLDQLETRLRETEAGAITAASYATQAERLMIAFATRRAIERGLPLGPLEEQLRRRFGERNADEVATVIQSAGQPVTLEDLRLALDSIAPRLASSPGEGWWSGTARILGDLVVVRSSDTPSPRAADRLRRARRTLQEGQVEAALAEVVHMPGADSAQSWVSAAKRYIAGREALRSIEIAAMESPSGAR